MIAQPEGTEENKFVGKDREPQMSKVASKLWANYHAKINRSIILSRPDRWNLA